MSVAREEMPVTVDNMRFFAGAARTLEGRAAGEYMSSYTSMVRREPIGVVGQIAPWNYPLMMAIWKIGPALATGNTIVLKPSELTPLTALRLGELAAEVLPPGVLNVITGDGEPVGAGLVRHRDMRLASLTGSVETARRGEATSGDERSEAGWIARTAADTLKRVHLELGGKAPMVVLDDADPAAVAAGRKLAGYYNSGQDCTAAARILAAPGIHDELVEAIVPAVESLTVRGTLRDRGAFVAPTVLTGVGQRDEIVQEEVFGPVVTVQRFESDERRSRGRTTSRTGSRRRSGRATSGARCPRRGRSSSAACGSTTTSRSRRRCRTAASRSRVTARTCRSTRWRTTRRSST
jgi:betaine-aldehyde dehydrogenase